MPRKQTRAPTRDGDDALHFCGLEVAAHSQGAHLREQDPRKGMTSCSWDSESVCRPGQARYAASPAQRMQHVHALIHPPLYSPAAPRGEWPSCCAARGSPAQRRAPGPCRRAKAAGGRASGFVACADTGHSIQKQPKPPVAPAATTVDIKCSSARSAAGHLGLA